MYRNTLLLILSNLLIFMTGSLTSRAQGEGNVWTFGNHNGLDFNQNPPVFFQSSNVSLEGCASIADASGNLLFYSNGNTVWDAAGNVMPNGTGLLGNGAWIGIPGSSSQGVSIVKSVQNAQQYYVFVLDAAEDINPFNYPGYLRYSVVDMSLNGGLGDVIPAQKNIMLDTAMSERMTVTKGVGCSYWLLTHRNNSSAYRVFKIDVNGIDPVPVVSNGLWQGDIGGGQLKVSPDGTKLVTTSTLQGAGIELADFDKNTGIISNFVGLGGGGPVSYYGTCFSPDNSKLYITQFSGYLLQYDLSLLPNTAAMEASKYTYPQALQYSGLRNAPNGKIYVAIFQNTPYIGCINNPNGLGAACNFDPNALAQPSYAQFTSLAGNPYGHGLGDDVVIVAGGDTVAHKTTDTLNCLADEIILNASDSFGSYIWDDGSSGPSRTVDQSGTYWVYMMDECAVFTDTFHVTMGSFSVDLGADTSICPGGALVLDPHIPGGSCLWQDGSTQGTFTVQEAGTYFVRVTLNGCSDGDTISINTYNPSVDIPENDTTLCEGDSTTLHATAVPPGILNWSNGSTGNECNAGRPGWYTVITTNACGIFRDSVYIDQMNCNCQAFIPNAFSPNGDLLNDQFKVEIPCNYSDFHIQIFNRWGNRIFNGLSADAAWNGLQNGRPCDAGTYFYYLRYKGVRGESFEKKGDLLLIR